ncbi:MAG: undecaprenyldiphospho-muramoylpentapeptide beta-N-acetylglucosaminyltransferase [Vulcanibacillus sp.]
MKYIVTGGGTGGHIYPALAIINEIKRRDLEAEFLYIGTDAGLEKDIVSKINIPFSTIDVKGFKRKLTIENLHTINMFFKSVSLSKKYIQAFQPDVVIGTGGFVCGPVLYAASKLKIPTIIHEQNVIPGLTNKFLSQYVDVIGISFAGSKKYFKNTKKVKLTGNPCATEVIKADKQKGYHFLDITSSKKVILIFGGSRGAKAINNTFLEMLPKLNEYENYHFVFVTGNIHYDSIMEEVNKIQQKIENVSIFPYLYNMPEILAISDVIISRAGASTLSEVTALGIPSILIPSPYVTNNHQEKNAQWLENQGAAKMIRERELNGEILLDFIEDVIRNHEVLSSNAKSVGIKDSAMLLYNEIIILLSNK